MAQQATAPKLYKPIVLAIAFIGMLGAQFASADDDDDRRKYRHKDRVHHYDRDHRHDRKHRNKRRHGIVRLDLPVDVYGSERIRLRRLIRHHYDIDLSQYQLRKVVVNNRNHSRRGYTQIRVGDHSTERYPLHPGRIHVKAPATQGPWILGIRRGHVDNIRVVLEPKYGQAYAHNNHRRYRQYDRNRYRPYRHGYDRYAYRRW